MSTTLSIAYAQGRTVKVKAAPMTTLQAVVSEACAKIPNSAHPESYQLIHNKKALDLSLPVRFANLPQGATLTLKRVSSAAPTASSISRPQQKGGNGSSRQQLIKVALQVVGGSRIINDFDSSATLWDIVYSAEDGAQGTLNLTARYRDGSPGTHRNGGGGGGSTSPLESVQRAVFGPMQNLYNSISASAPSSPSSSHSSQQQQQQKPVAHTKQVYQQPVLQLPGREITTFEEMQATTLRSLGFTSGQALIRLFFKDALAPSTLPARNAAPIQQRQELQAQKIDRPRTPPAPKAADEPTPATAKQPASSNSTSPAPKVTLVSHRHVQVFGNHAGESATPVQIVLPESFYDPNSTDDASLLIKAQRARLAEADRGFKMRSTEDKKRLEQHERFKHDHPTTVIRFRFPDITHVQATFASTETTDELFRFAQSVLSNPRLLNTLVMQPPLRDLRNMAGISLFDAKMTPAVVVHVQLHPDAAGSAALDLLRPEIAALAQPLPSNAMEESAWPVAENSGSNTDAATNAALDHMPVPSSSSPSTAPQSSSSRASREQQQQQQQQTKATTSAQGTKMPKWFLAGQQKR